jgi:hypothetical protein
VRNRTERDLTGSAEKRAEMDGKRRSFTRRCSLRFAGTPLGGVRLNVPFVLRTSAAARKNSNEFGSPLILHNLYYREHRHHLSIAQASLALHSVRTIFLEPLS